MSSPFPHTKSNCLCASLHLSQLNIWPQDLARSGVIDLPTSPTADALSVETLVFGCQRPIVLRVVFNGTICLQLQYNEAIPDSPDNPMQYLMILDNVNMVLVSRSLIPLVVR